MSVLSDLFRRLLKGKGDDIAEKVAQNYGDDAVRATFSQSVCAWLRRSGRLIWFIQWSKRLR